MRILSYYRRALVLSLREPALRMLTVAAVSVLLAGTVFYRIAEDWTWVDALYFSTVTLATIGYGDLVPTSDLSRLVTVAYVLFGLGIVAAFLNVLVRAPLLYGDGDGPLALSSGGRVAPAQRQGRLHRRSRRHTWRRRQSPGNDSSLSRT